VAAHWGPTSQGVALRGPRVSLGGGGQGGGRLPRRGATYPSLLYNPPPLDPLPWLIHPSLQSSPLSLGSHVRSCARELEETPPTGRHRAAGFSVRVHLLTLLRWTRARMTSIHWTCVIPRKRCHLWHLASSSHLTTRP
jgi:hypothetical protein